MPKKQSKNTVTAVISQIQNDIDDTTRDLSDAEYLEVLEDIEGYIKSCIEAKKEEMEK